MRSDAWGRIVNVISTSVREPIPNLGVSNTVRGAVAGWAKTLSRELAPHGIRVNAIAPGDIQTERNQDITNALKERGVKGDYFRRVPIGRRGTPAEIGPTAVFLASDDASYITGETIIVDGGFLIY